MTAPTTRKPVVATDVFNTTLTLNFRTGEELAVTLESLSPEILKQAALHGLKQKLVDAAAIARDPETGLSATDDDKFRAVKVVFDRITRPDGTWNAIREGEVKQAGGIFLRAMMEVTGKDKETAQAAIAAYSKEQVAALKKNPRVLEVMQRMEREAAAKVADTSDDLLAALAGDVVMAQPESDDVLNGDGSEFVTRAPAKKGKK